MTFSPGPDYVIQKTWPRPVISHQMKFKPRKPRIFYRT